MCHQTDHGIVCGCALMTSLGQVSIAPIALEIGWMVKQALKGNMVEPKLIVATTNLQRFAAINPI